MPNNVFLACFLGCLLAFAIVAIFAWQVGGWFVARAFRSIGITQKTMTFGGGVQVSAGTEAHAPIQVDRPWFVAEPSADQLALARAAHEARYAEFLDEMRAVVLMGAHLAQHAPPPQTLSEREMAAWNGLIENARHALDLEADARKQAERGEPTRRSSGEASSPSQPRDRDEKDTPPS